MRRPEDGSRRAWLLAAIGIYLSATTWILSSRHYWPRYDSGVYISAATSLSRGIGLRDVTSPVTRPASGWAYVPTWVRRSPAAMDRPDWPVFTNYPPLLPLVLAPLVRLGGGRFLALQLVPMLAGLATLGFAYRWRGALLPGPWPLTLLLSAGSMLALYGTRVQSEAVHALFALAALRVLARADDEPDRLTRWAGLAALVLLLGVAVHVKLVFFAAGAAAWLLVGPRASLVRRVTTATAFAVVTVGPPVAFTFAASWANPAGLPPGAGAYTLRHNPYYATDGWDLSAPFVERATLLRVAAGRAANTGTFLWDGLTNGFANARPGLAELVLLGAAALLAGPWWRHRRGLLALPTLAYVAAVVLSPWTEARMSAPILVIAAHALAMALARVPRLLGVHGEPAARQALLAGGAAILAVQLVNWWRLTPRADEYALECFHHPPTLALARVAAALPEERPVLAPVDNAAFAIVTGRATQSTFRGEWKTSNPLVFLTSGGAPVALSPIVPLRHLEGAVALGGEMARLAGPRTRQIVDLGEGYGLVAEWVILPPPPPGTVPEEPIVPGRIHPRWMRLTPADREPLARAAIPAVAR